MFSFDNDEDVHIHSTKYEESGYGLCLSLQIILCLSCVAYPRRSRLFEISNHVTLHFPSNRFLVDGWVIPYINPTQLIHLQS